MNPLSPLTYYRRHKVQALLLVGLITLTTIGIYLIVGILDSSVERNSINLLTRFSYIQSDDPTVVAQIRAHPDVAHVIPEIDIPISAPSLVGGLAQFAVIGAPEDSLPTLVDVCNVRLKEGRLPHPRTNEIVLSEEIVRALDLHIGDQIGRTINEQYYGFVPTELTLVGILESTFSIDREPKVRIGFASYEYLQSHERYASTTPGQIVIPHQGRRAVMNAFLQTLDDDTYVETLERRLVPLRKFQRVFYLIYGVVDGLVAIVVALIVGVINRIVLAQRVSELGLLNALGRSKNKLIHRVTSETATVVGAGWFAGLSLSWLIFAWLNTNIYQPKGAELDLMNPASFWFTVPIPLVAISFVALSAARVFARLDPVAIVERDKLSMESKQRKAVSRSSSQPLSSTTFYRRHRSRGAMQVIVTALMILGIVFPAFLFSSVIDMQILTGLSYLRQVNIVSPARWHGDIDPGVTAQIKTHPAVKHVIPTLRFHLELDIPVDDAGGMTVYAVSEDDLPILLDVYHVHLKEGHLPRPRTNEIVISESAALNRGLRVGDSVGPPVYEQDLFPAEMEVVGILRRDNASSHDLWMGFASYEYAESFLNTFVTNLNLLIVPLDGHRLELDIWMESNVASTRISVDTYDATYHNLQQHKRNLMLMLAAIESVIVIVAAIALAVLNYFFFAQRQEEFGTLHALGHSRPWLVLRTAKETISVVAVAWLVGALVCIVGLIYAQADVYVPKGLSLNFANFAPWLFTLPIPLIVVIVSAGTITWMLRRLDPVSIIERR
jgi:ABC-type lipoprotein release transport system permease subunit